ncbi:MAG: NucA/NucB deoxyribonuclease domain-containing protein [Mycobacteriales bacterium]
MVQNKRALLSVLTVGLALLLTGGVRSAAADQGTAPHRQKPGTTSTKVRQMSPAIPESSYCDAVKKKAQARRNGSANPGHRSLCFLHSGTATSMPKPNIPSDWPDQCLPNEMYVIDRLHGCRWDDWNIGILQDDTGDIVGTGELDLFHSDSLNAGARELTEHLEILVSNTTGVLATSPSTIRGEFLCRPTNASCTLMSQSLPVNTEVPLYPDIPLIVDGTLTADAEPQPQPLWISMLGNAAPNTSELPVGTFELWGIRCDNDPVFAHTNPSGCVYAQTVFCENRTKDASPQTCTWDTYVPTFTISLSGNAPETAAHIQEAENRLVGEPGVDQINGHPLTRQTDPKQIRANRRTACSASVFQRQFVNDSCDEYPFASTNQGAAKANGNYSTEHVPLNDNKSGGAQLGGFYSSNRILNGDPFWVRVIG